MKRLAFILVFTLCGLFASQEIFSQNITEADWHGTWVLDSVQVHEIMPDSMVQRTVLPGGYSKFNSSWMFTFTLGEGNEAIYTEAADRKFENVRYEIKDMVEDRSTLEIYAGPYYNQWSMQMFSGGALMIYKSFTETYELKPISVSWKMYYHKYSND